MKISFVSSMNLKLYEYYGKRFLEEFAKYSSKDIFLYIMFEGKFPDECLHIADNIVILSFGTKSHSNFISKFGHLHEANGLRIKTIIEEGIKKIQIKNDYRWNAVRFSFKPFSIYQVKDFLPKDIDYLIWTDSDLRCKKNFSSIDLIEFMPDKNQIMSYLGRDGSYSECGFLGFNMKNQTTNTFLETMVNIYESGDIFSIEQWHDSYIWDHVRKKFELEKLGLFKDISGDGRDKEHVFMNTGLSNFFDHLKGPQRKKEGQSNSEDFLKKVSGKLLI